MTELSKEQHDRVMAYIRGATDFGIAAEDIRAMLAKYHGVDLTLEEIGKMQAITGCTWTARRGLK